MSAASGVVVSIHDVAPATAEQSRQWVQDVERLGVRATLLVVPGPFHGAALDDDDRFGAWLRARAGDGHEIALHGWDHQHVPGAPFVKQVTGAVVARGCAEFWALDEHEARRRLLLGRETLHNAALSSCGFTPPGWLASAASIRALVRLGFRYTTTHRGIVDLVSGRRIDAPALSHRPGGRGERIGESIMRTVAAWRSRRDQLVRIALHPADLARPRLRATTLTAIADALAAGLRPRTYEEVVASP